MEVGGKSVVEVFQPQMLSRNWGMQTVWSQHPQSRSRTRLRSGRAESYQRFSLIRVGNGCDMFWISEGPAKAVFEKQRDGSGDEAVLRRKRKSVQWSIHPIGLFFPQVYPVACLQGHTVSG